MILPGGGSQLVASVRDTTVFQTSQPGESIDYLRLQAFLNIQQEERGVGILQRVLTSHSPCFYAVFLFRCGFFSTTCFFNDTNSHSWVTSGSCLGQWQGLSFVLWGYPWTAKSRWMNAAVLLREGPGLVQEIIDTEEREWTRVGQTNGVKPIAEWNTQSEWKRQAELGSEWKNQGWFRCSALLAFTA